MTQQERIKDILRSAFRQAEETTLTFCPDNHARRIAQVSLQQSLRFALLSIDQVDTKPEIVVPGH